MVGSSYRDIKKLIFSAPSKCPIDLFGPVANRTALKRLQARVPSLLASVSYMPLAVKHRSRF